jgi:AcrR family transcriptional regulator
MTSTEHVNGTRERILSAAASVLSRKGYAGARLSDISELADLKTPAVYYYFDSREHLIHEVMTVGQRSVLDYVTEALDGLPAGSSALTRLDRAVEAHLEVELSLSDFATAVTRNIGQLPLDVQEGFRADGHRYFEIWDELLAELAEDGLLRADLNLRVARMLLLGALNSTAEWWDPSSGTLEEVIETAKQMVRGSVCGTGHLA